MKLNNVQIDLIRNCIDRAITVIEHVRNVSTSVERIEDDRLAIRSLISVSINGNDSKDKLMTEIALNFRIDSTDFEKCEYHFDDGFTAQQVGNIENVDEKIKEIKDEIEKNLKAVDVQYQTYWVLAEHEEDTLYIECSNLDQVSNFNIDLEIDSYEESDSNSIKVKLNLKFDGMTIFDSEGSELCIVDGRAIVEAKANKTVINHRNFYSLIESDIDEFWFTEDREVAEDDSSQVAKLVVETLDRCLNRSAVTFAFSSDDYV